MQWSKLLCPERIRTQQHKAKEDLRTEFEKDYQRIIGSASFRRLQDKTQVFPMDASDFVRTRLTHSLEVSSYAKSLGQNVAEKILNEIKDPDFLPENKADISDILQCAGLIHDIGNPPFGHFGETAIREWFLNHLSDFSLGGVPVEQMLNDQMKNDFYHFEGNTQAFRVVTKLHFLVDENGMNLTKALLATMMKYPCSSLEIDPDCGDIARKKMGYFYADRDNFEAVQSAVGTNGARHPLAFLLEAADDIAYITADIEDAYKKGYISYRELLIELNACWKNHREQMTTLEDEEAFTNMLHRLEQKYDRAIEKKIKDPGEYAVQNWIISVQSLAIEAVTKNFIRNYDAIMQGTYRDELFHGSEAETLMTALGDIEVRYVFRSRPIYKREIAEEVILNFLLDKFIDAAIVYDTEEKMSAVQIKLMGLVSDNYMSIYKHFSKDKSKEEKLYLRLLLVTDYICGMTDNYAKALYQELTGMF